MHQDLLKECQQSKVWLGHLPRILLVCYPFGEKIVNSVLNRQVLAGRDEPDIAEQVIQGGAKVIQLRDKQSSKAELLPTARKLKGLCSKSDILFMVNDYLDLALVIDADGLHIGQKDLPLPVV